ncbi:hypothetical protein KUCAC02_034837, partial [Chaenocephalus aceratus]
MTDFCLYFLEFLRHRAKRGENVTLQCNSSTDAAITKLEWKRPELGDDYVFLFKNKKPFYNYQSPRYRGRVELKDPEMKNGNASVLLKSVTTDDTGMYECWVITDSNNDRKRDAYIQLRVSEGLTKEIKNEHLKNGDANDEQPEDSRGH